MKFSELPEHHAILLTHGDRASYTDTLWSELSPISPAYRLFNQTVLDIDTARSIISWSQSPYNGARVALISFHTAGIPAQNAMLKMLEEPKAGTRFVLVTSNRSGLLDTVLSRLHHIPLTAEDNDTRNAKEFLATTSAFRMKLSFIVDLLSGVDEEGRKDREGIKKFILTLVEILKEKKADARYIEETLVIASYVSDPSASGKALLEYLTLLLPVIK